MKKTQQDEARADRGRADSSTIRQGSPIPGCWGGPGASLSFSSAAVWAVVSGAVSLGDTVTLPCDLELRHETTWFLQRNETLALRIIASKNQVEQQTEPFYYVIRPDSRFSLVLNPSTNSSSLRIEGVTETDQGLYYCTTRERGEVQIGKGTRLRLHGEELSSKENGEHPSGIGWSCLIILIVAPPLSTLMTSCFVFCLFDRPGRPQDRKGDRSLVQRQGRRPEGYENPSINVLQRHKTGHAASSSLVS
nr:PREDICTED: uncharacterized protein LOC107076051 isoform X2 [Lepisosteus oculatus]